MAATIDGTAYLFPVAIAPSLTPAGGSAATLAGLVINFRPAQTHGVNVTVTNMPGHVVTRRYDDKTYNATCDYLPTASATIFPAAGDKIAFSSSQDAKWDGSYRITDVTGPINRGEHIVYSLTLIRSESVTLS